MFCLTFMWEEPVTLKHHIGGPRLGRQMRHILAVNDDPACAGTDEAANHPEQRGLAAAGGTQNGKKVAFHDVEVEQLDRRHRAIGFGNAAKAYRNHVRFQVTPHRRKTWFLAELSGYFAYCPVRRSAPLIER
jgi:hypothetical protein